MNPTTKNPPSIKAAAVALIILCLITLSWATQRATAAWQFFAAETITQNLHDAKVFNVATLDQATARINKALARFPQNPDYLGLAGHLKEQRASLPGVVGREQRELLEAAAEYHRQALATRPLWPYSWASLLSCKDKLGQADPEFNAAMHRAAELGRWEPAVQLQVLRSGIRYWDELKSGERALVRASMTDALKVQPREAFEIARFYARPDLVCGVETGQAQIERWCRNFL
jgi:hypothetical protein